MKLSGCAPASHAGLPKAHGTPETVGLLLASVVQTTAQTRHGMTPGFDQHRSSPGNRPGPLVLIWSPSLGTSCLGRPLLFPHWVKSSERSKACPMPAEELLLIVSPSQEMLSFISLNQLNRSNPVGHLRFD